MNHPYFPMDSALSRASVKGLTPSATCSLCLAQISCAALCSSSSLRNGSGICLPTPESAARAEAALLANGESPGSKSIMSYLMLSMPRDFFFAVSSFGVRSVAHVPEHLRELLHHVNLLHGHDLLHSYPERLELLGTRFLI